MFEITCRGSNHKKHSLQSYIVFVTQMSFFFVFSVCSEYGSTFQKVQHSYFNTKSFADLKRYTLEQCSNECVHAQSDSGHLCTSANYNTGSGACSLFEQSAGTLPGSLVRDELGGENSVYLQRDCICPLDNRLCSCE